jgi:hypothetical protein
MDRAISYASTRRSYEYQQACDRVYRCLWALPLERSTELSTDLRTLSDNGGLIATC